MNHAVVSLISNLSLHVLSSFDILVSFSICLPCVRALPSTFCMLRSTNTSCCATTIQTTTRPLSRLRRFSHGVLLPVLHPDPGEPSAYKNPTSSPHCDTVRCKLLCLHRSTTRSPSRRSSTRRRGSWSRVVAGTQGCAHAAPRREAGACAFAPVCAHVASSARTCAACRPAKLAVAAPAPRRAARCARSSRRTRGVSWRETQRAGWRYSTSSSAPRASTASPPPRRPRSPPSAARARRAAPCGAGSACAGGGARGAATWSYHGAACAARSYR
jgi:hypothetical protein